jgi:outer membrane protein assembly factor BamA
MRARLIAGAIVLAAAWPAPARAQEPATRAEALEAEREAKSKQLTPYEPTGLERALLRLENDRVLERLLNPPVGFHPKIGNVTPGSGFSIGPGYRRPQLFGGHADFSAFAAGSFKKYWMIDARLTMPRLAANRAFLDIHGQRYDFPEETFFGLGPASRREDEATYGLQNAVVGANGGVRVLPALTVGGGLDYLTPSVSARDASQTITALFDPADVPGLLEQPDFLRYQASADLNYREPSGNPRRGGRYLVTYSRFDDRDSGRYSFNRVDVDLQQYIPLLKDRRVLALRALASMADAGDGHVVPFYFQPTLGGPDDLRGFRRFRFRDRNALLLQAEYRWEIFTAVDGAIFYDAGKVAARREDLDLHDLESDYGIGFRFGTINGVFLRIEGAFGSAGGKHFVFRFGHVF